MIIWNNGTLQNYWTNENTSGQILFWSYLKNYLNVNKPSVIGE